MAESRLLGRLIEQLTAEGRTASEDELKQLKLQLRASDETVKAVHVLLCDRLGAKHAQVGGGRAANTPRTSRGASHRSPAAPRTGARPPAGAPVRCGAHGHDLHALKAVQVAGRRRPPAAPCLSLCRRRSWVLGCMAPAMHGSMRPPPRLLVSCPCHHHHSHHHHPLPPLPFPPPPRSLVAASFSCFMELAVGHVEGRPLPPPAAVAALLRAKALEVVERWAKRFGGAYPQAGHGQQGGPLVRALQGRRAPRHPHHSAAGRSRSPWAPHAGPPGA